MMRNRWLSAFLVFLVLAQPVASYGAMLHGAEEPAASMAMDCHDKSPASIVPDCCDEMDGASCGMDCSTVSSAVATRVSLDSEPDHGPVNVERRHVEPHSLTGSLFKPPRTS
jgi:hypothetical protein